MPKPDDLKRPKTITLIDNDNKATTENDPVDYDKWELHKATSSVNSGVIANIAFHFIWQLATE